MICVDDKVEAILFYRVFCASGCSEADPCVVSQVEDKVALILVVGFL